MSVLLTPGLTPPPTDEEIKEGIRIAANLIAAAPDLLAALRAAATMLEFHDAKCKALKLARAAIAKAEGTS